MTDEQLLMWGNVMNKDIIAAVQDGRLTKEQGIKAVTRVRDDALFLLDQDPSCRRYMITLMAAHIESKDL